MIMTRISAEKAKYEEGYWWTWYYGYGFMDDYGNYQEVYNPNHPYLKS